jgi:predicted nuclease of predicted toxin-antitoxin system
MSVTFLLDQNIRADTLEFLRTLGLDVTSTRELGLQQASDDEIAKVARDIDAVIVTFNMDFADIRFYPLGAHAGVSRLRIEPQTIEVVHPILENLFTTIPGEQFQGALTTGTKDKIRIRHK